jgi:hypothetical protein
MFTRIVSVEDIELVLSIFGLNSKVIVGNYNKIWITFYDIHWYSFIQKRKIREAMNYLRRNTPLMWEIIEVYNNEV